VRTASPSRARRLRKKFSSSSLRSMKSRNHSVPNADDGTDMSPRTPVGGPQTGAGPGSRHPALPTLPTPLSAAFKERSAGGGAIGGLHLFDNTIHSPTTP